MEKCRTIHTVPLHMGENIEVPKGSKVTYYDHDKYVNNDRQAASPDYLQTAVTESGLDGLALDDFSGLPKPVEGVACVPWSELAEKFCDEIQRRHHDKLSMQEVRDLGYDLYKIVLSN